MIDEEYDGKFLTEDGYWIDMENLESNKIKDIKKANPLLPDDKDTIN